MSSSASPNAYTTQPAGPWFRRPAVPSWLISMLLHLLLVVVLGITLQLAPSGGTGVERTAEVGIVLKHEDGQREYFQGQNDGAEQSEAAASADAAGGLASLLGDTPPVDPTSVLPSTAPVIGLGALEGGGMGTARGAASGAGAGTGGKGVGGEGRTGVFGVEGTGYKFVYVFDRSGSMGGSGRNALAAVKVELLASLRNLEQTHQFQIIFYNEQTYKFNPTGNPDRLVFANDRNKALAERFVQSVTSDGGTDHHKALVEAIRLRPDVIFFLTDADQPRLSANELDAIHRMAAGITIHTIEFGYGPQADSDNFLVRLARQNGGQHAYVDISKMSPAAR